MCSFGNSYFDIRHLALNLPAQFGCIMATTDSSLHNVSSGMQAMKSSFETEAITSAENLESSSIPSRYVPSYHFKALKNKGAIIVLLWTFSALYAFHAFSPILPHREHTTLSPSKGFMNPFVIFILSLLLYPLLGCLADTHCGRYSMIKWSLRALWLISTLFCAISALLQYFNPSSSEWLQHAYFILLYAVYAPIFICVGGFIVSGFQFGFDQLADASSGEIVSFFHWILWAWFFSDFLAALSRSCVCLDYKPVGYFFIPLLLTIAVALDFIFNHRLVKEPLTGNPIALILKVLTYTIKNKYPRRGSALTYLDGRRNSRIDLAKNIFGGPFTTEQVEDVKSFFRIFGVIIAGDFFCSIYMAAFPQFGEVVYHLHDGHFIRKSSVECEHAFLRDCFGRLAVNFTGPLLLVIGLPLFEFVLYPLFKRYLQVFILRKLSVGLLLLLLSVAACAIIELVAHLKSHELTSLSCPFNTTAEHEPNSLPLDYKWTIIPYTLSSFGQYLILTSFGEFLSAQSPYSMKGLLFGLSFGTLGVFSVLGYLLLKPIQLLSEKLMPDHYGCLFWYFLLTLGILLVILSVYLIVFKCYKKRHRQDTVQEEN